MPAKDTFSGPPPSEYFERKQQQYVRQVSKGRHPRSFPRESELQYFAITTGARLAKIRAGHNTWHVLEDSSVNEDKEEDNDFEDEASRGVAANSLAAAEYAPLEASSSLITPTPPPPTTPANAAAAAANFGSVLINGMQIDIRNKTQLHYGQMVVVMGEKNNIVCVSQETNEIKLKPQDSVLPTDRTLFKLIDLRDSSNPHAVKYGEPLWLQIIDVSGNPGTLYGWNQAMALCSKLFDLHETDTKHLNPSWEKHTLRQDVLRRSTYQQEDGDGDGDGEEKDDANKAAGPASSSSSASASSGAGAGAKRQSKGWGRLRGKLPRGGGGAAAEEASPAPEKEGGSKGDPAPSSSDHASIVGTAAANSSAGSGGRVGGGRGRGGGDDGRGGRGGGGGGQHARREHEPEAIICGGSHAVLIGAMALQAKKKLDEEMSTMPGASKVASREAWIMGQVALHAAERPGGHDLSQGKSKSKGKSKGEAQVAVGQLGDVAHSNTPLYMAQDVYCFASSAGSAWSTWPLKSNEIAPPMDLADPQSPHGSPANKGGGGGGEGQGADDDDKSVHSHVSGKSHASHASHASLSSNAASLTGKAAPPAESAIVMRKLLAKRPPHEFVVDKRCVFRFCPVDNVSDTSQLSQQEIHAQKLQAKAKAGLRRSEITRKGGRVYPSSDGDVVPLPCGEKFSLRLRQNVSTKELRSLGEQLLPRRDKEKVIKEHFLAYCGPAWDRGDDSDSVSVASMSIVKQPIASLLSAARSVGGGGSLDGGPSLGSLSVDESMGQPGSADLGPGPSLAAQVQRVRVSLPPDHTQAHEASQKALLEQAQRSKVLRPYHYNNFPNYYKTVVPAPGTVIRPRVLNYNDPRLSDGETVVSLRQALQGISGRVVHDMSLAAALDAVSGPGQRRRDITPLNPARPDVMSKIHAQNELIEMSLDHLDRLKALTEVTKTRANFTV